MANQVLGKFYGAAQLALCMRSGLDVFDDDKKKALRSLLIPILCAIPGLFYAIHFPAADLEGAPASDIILTGVVRFVISFPLSLYGVYLLSRYLLNKQEHFWQWLQASNWLSAVFFIVFGVPKLLVASNVFTKCYMYQYTVFLELYAYGVAWYLFYRAFRTNIYWSGVMTVLMIMINQEVGRFVFMALGYGFDPRSGECGG